MDQRQTSQVELLFNVYLDEGYESGDVEHTILHPAAGDAVLFYQAVHRILPCSGCLKSGIKNMMRSDVMYRFASEAEADVGGLAVVGGSKMM